MNQFILFRGFYDKECNFLKVLEASDEKVPSYSLNHEVVFWHDVVAPDAKAAIIMLKHIGKTEKRHAKL